MLLQPWTDPVDLDSDVGSSGCGNAEEADVDGERDGAGGNVELPGELGPAGGDDFEAGLTVRVELVEEAFGAVGLAYAHQALHLQAIRTD